MPQVSVMPANTSPAPTKAASAMKAGWTKKPSAAPTTTSDPGGDADLAFQRDGVLAAFDGQAGGDPGVGAALDVDGLVAAGRREGCAGFRRPGASLANCIHGTVGSAASGCKQFGRVELVEWHVAGSGHVCGAELGGGSYVDQVNRLAALEPLVQLGAGNGVHGSTPIGRLTSVHKYRDFTRLRYINVKK